MHRVVIDTSDTTVQADKANTRYIVKQGVDIVPADNQADAINAKSAANGRVFDIAGHLGGYGGIELGTAKNHDHAGIIHVEATGKIDAFYVGLAVESDGGVIINDGTLVSSVRGIVAHGANLSITNTGTIGGEVAAIEFGGNHALMTNVGAIYGSIFGVSMEGAAKESLTLRNTGTITGVTFAISGSVGDDHVVNSGTVNGNIALGKGNDSYDGKGGVAYGIVDGGAGNDVLTGGAGIDQLSGGHGHDVMTGRGGADVFLFSTGFDADTVTDFQASGAGHDILDLSHLKGFDSFADLKSHIHQDGQDTAIDFGGGDELTLLHLDHGQVTKADFFFG